MKINFGMTTRTRLIIAFFLVALIPMSLLAVLNNRTTREALIDDANQALFAVASQTAASLDTFIASNMEAIRTEAQLPTLVKFLHQGAGESDVIELLETLSVKNGYITSYALIDDQGIVVADTVRGGIGEDKSDRDYYAYFFSPHESDYFVSNVQFSETTQQPSLYFSSAVHAEDGSVLGVLRVRYSADVLQVLLEEQNNLAGQGSFGVLFDEYHIHLAHGVQPEVNFVPIVRFDDQTHQQLVGMNRLADLPEGEMYPLQLDDLQEHLSNPDTQRFFEAEDVATGDLINQVAIAELEAMPWLVTFFQPQEIFLSPVVSQTQNTAVLFALFAVLAIVVAFGVGNVLGRPIVNLAGTMTQFTGGDMEARSDIHSSDEIGTLASNFNEMANRVQVLLTGLEQHANELEVEIGERKRIEGALRSSEERYRSISDLTSDYIYSVSITEMDEMALNWSTEAFSRLTGYTPDELSALGGWPKLVHLEDRAAFVEGRKQLLESGNSDVIEYRIVTKSGSVRWLRDYRRVTRGLNGQAELLLGAAQDITKQKQKDSELEHARDEAELANLAKSAFLANMSHELRTPLNAILGFSQLLVNKPTLDPQSREHLNIINRSGSHLLTLINDVLEMSKIEAGRTTLQPNSFDLYKLLEEVQDMLNLRASEQGLRLLFEHTEDTPRYVSTDEGKLRQILINLVSNAVKFTQEGGVSVRVRPVEGGGTQRLQFEVEDSGAGIPQDELESLFDAFVQTSTGEKTKEGTGLGLSISREFVRLMGGDIKVVTEPGKGSIFSFTIEVDLVQAAQVAADKPSRRVTGMAEGQPSYRILVVDDQEENRKLLVELLRPLGFEVREAVNGLEAVSVWQSWDPHLIWMDMRMPVLDGYKATSRIRTLPNGADTVIIALTASAFEENRAMSLEAGAYDFVRKPFRSDEIFDRLASHLGIEFIYAEDAAVLAPKAVTGSLTTITPQALAGLPDRWKAELHRVSAQADAEAAIGLIDQIRAQEPGLAETLTDLVNNFRFDILMQITEQVGV